MDYPAATEAVAPTPKLDASLRPYHPAPGTDAAPAVPAVSLSVAKAAGDLARQVGRRSGLQFKFAHRRQGQQSLLVGAQQLSFLEGQQRRSLR